jgi:hypothetical protein
MRVLTLRRAGQEINVSKYNSRTDLYTRLLFDVSHEPDDAGETEVFLFERSINLRGTPISHSGSQSAFYKLRLLNEAGGPRQRTKR